MARINNPYADKDGAPVDGKEAQFFAWEKEQAKKELEKLPADKQKEIKESEAALNDRMNS